MTKYPASLIRNYPEAIVAGRNYLVNYDKVEFKHFERYNQADQRRISAWTHSLLKLVEVSVEIADDKQSETAWVEPAKAILRVCGYDSPHHRGVEKSLLFDDRPDTIELQAELYRECKALKEEAVLATSS